MIGEIRTLFSAEVLTRNLAYACHESEEQSLGLSCIYDLQVGAIDPALRIDIKP